LTFPQFRELSAFAHEKINLDGLGERTGVTTQSDEDDTEGFEKAVEAAKERHGTDSVKLEEVVKEMYNGDENRRCIRVHRSSHK